MEMSMPFAYSSSIGALSSKFSTSSISVGGEERRREGNGTMVFNPSQTLLQHPSHLHSPCPQKQENSSPPELLQHNQDLDAVEDPVPVPVTIAVTAPLSVGGSNSKTPTILVRYKECLKNYAANIGGHVVDGCGEFMPSGEESLKCAACDCHRNFHRKEMDGIPRAKSLLLLSPPPVHQKLPLGLPTSPPHLSGRIMHPFGSGAESSSEDREVLPSPLMHAKKRFRTKFSREQKDKMLEFAEKIGWRIQKQEEQVFQQFCDEVGVKKNVLKVWMHNNKQAMKRKNLQEDMQQQRQEEELL